MSKDTDNCRNLQSIDSLTNPAKMKSILLPSAAILCIISVSFSQTPAIQWQKTTGGDKSDVLRSLQTTTDGGYILCGISRSNISGDKTENNVGYSDDFWIIKLNAYGDIQWQKTIGGSANEYFPSIKQTADGGYILGGTSVSGISGDKNEDNKGGTDFWVLKLNSSGSIQWQKSLGGSADDYLEALDQTTDGGYLLGGSSKSGISGDKAEANLGKNDYWVVKLDGTGAIEWQNTIGGSDSEALRSLASTSDGGAILAGTSISGISADKSEGNLGNYDFWIVKLDLNGNLQWQNTIGGNGYDDPSSINETTDGGFILSGYSSSDFSGDKTENSIGGHDFWVIKLNELGDTQWQNTIGGSFTEGLCTVSGTNDGGYILGGISDSEISGDKTENSFGINDYWVLKLDGSGNIEWQKTIGGNGSEALLAIQQTLDGGYILGGSSDSDISRDKTENSKGDYDYWIVKLAGTVPSTELSVERNSVEIYPNPATDELFVRTDFRTAFTLCNTVGQQLLNQTIYGDDKIDLSALPDGIYFLIETETGYAHKILKNK